MVRMLFVAFLMAGIANADATSTLTYRKPSAVFAAYSNAELDRMAAELDPIFARIAEAAVR